MSKIVSFLVPTRGRPFGMQNVIESIRSTADDLSRVEVLFLIDDDDIASLDWIASIETPSFVSFFQTPRIGNGYQHLYLYYNQLYSVSTGEFLFIFNDDTTMMSKGWDSVLARLTGQCVMLDPKWTYSAPWATFPIVSRQIPERMGTFCEHVYVDRWLSFIADAAGCRIDATKGDHFIELDHIGDTDRRNNGPQSQYWNSTVPFPVPEIDMNRIHELAAKVKA